MAATKTKKKKPKEPAAGPPTDGILTLPVVYGNVSIGDETASISIVTDRRNLSLGKADQFLCGKRLTGKITAEAGSANPEQGAVPGMEAGDEITAAFDTRSFRATPKAISATLSFKIESVPIEILSHFAKRAGKFHVEEAIAIPKEEKGGGGGDQDDGEGDE